VTTGLPQTICFDLGSTIWDDRPALQTQWEILGEILADYGIEIDSTEIEIIAREIILSFAPTLTRVIVWKLVERNEPRYQEIISRMVNRMLPLLNDPAEFRRLNPLLPGAHATLEQLSRKHQLAVISNNFASAERWMDFHDLAGYFTHVTISGAERLHKPDPRLFLLTLDALGAKAPATAMVGDRLDNDVWPANRLGMTSIRILQGHYAIQTSRYHMDEPDICIHKLSELLEM
jgi:HAD superfamily hydrolase (TIGR01509 family)